MTQEVPQPIYYCPPGVKRPEHVRSFGAAQLREGHGPVGAEPGGFTYGGIFGEKQEYQKAPGGWWVHFAPGLAPWHMMRADAIMGIACGPWMFPTVIDPDGILAVSQVMRLNDAGELVWRPPDNLVSIIDQLRAIYNELKDVREQAMENTKLVEQLLQINYHVSLVELAMLGWMTSDLGESTLKAAWGIDPEFVPDVDEEPGDDG